MAFFTKKEKYAFVKGLIAGNRDKKPFVYKTKHRKVKKPRYSVYDDFDRTPSGRIKGSYTVDGFFEPD